MALTPKQQAFAREYLVDHNATQAAIRAGYSRVTAGSQAHDLLKKPEIQEILREVTRKHSEAVDLTVTSVLADIARLAALAESVGELATALKARELQGKHLKLFTDRVEVSGKLTLEQLVDAAAAKREG